MKAIQKGFTLIELMIVVAIVGILAAIALPAYQDYMVRAKMTEPLAKLDEMKTSVAEYVASNISMPSTGTLAGIFNSGTGAYYGATGYDYLSDTAGNVGVQLTGAANAALNGTWIVMQGAVQGDGAVRWTCSTTATSVGVTKYLPANCRSTVSTFAQD